MPGSNRRSASLILIVALLDNRYLDQDWKRVPERIPEICFQISLRESHHTFVSNPIRHSALPLSVPRSLRRRKVTTPSTFGEQPHRFRSLKGLQKFANLRRESSVSWPGV